MKVSREGGDGTGRGRDRLGRVPRGTERSEPSDGFGASEKVLEPGNGHHDLEHRKVTPRMDRR